MPQLKLPEIVFCFGWTPYYVQQQEQRERSSLIIMGDMPLKDESEPALVHFSGLNEFGGEKSWLWLFPDVESARSLRMLPKIYNGSPLTALIESTLPPNPPRQPKLIVLGQCPIAWLLGLSLEENGIHEIWYGFDRLQYARYRSMDKSTQMFSTEEFLKLVKRSV